MNIILFGPPGVGKGTQGVLLSDTFGWIRVVTGDLLRAARREGTALGLKAQEFMDAGELVPDSLVVDLIREHVETIPSNVSLIFDGFPRTVPQAEALDTLLEQLDREIDALVVLEASDEVLIRRISGRRSSPSGRVYNIYFDPPEAEGICDETGETLIHREDDNPETVRRRLEVYRTETAPVLDRYQALSAQVLKIPSESGVEEVQSGIRKALGLDGGEPVS